MNNAKKKENNRIGKTRDLFKKIGDTKGEFHAKVGTINDRNVKDLKEAEEKTTRPFRYDLNQIPYDYTVEVIDRFKRLDLIDRVPEELWTEICDTLRWRW